MWLRSTKNCRVHAAPFCRILRWFVKQETPAEAVQAVIVEAGPADSAQEIVRLFERLSGRPQFPKGHKSLAYSPDLSD